MTQSKAARTGSPRRGRQGETHIDALSPTAVQGPQKQNARGFGSECEIEKGCGVSAQIEGWASGTAFEEGQEWTMPVPFKGCPDQLGREGSLGHLPSRSWVLSDFGIYCSTSILQKGPAGALASQLPTVTVLVPTTP